MAYTLPQRGPSTRILETVGLEFDGEFEHPEDGNVWRWSQRFEQDAANGH
jgi:hypothetical protein